MNAGYVAVAGWLAGKAKGANLCCELDIVIVRQPKAGHLLNLIVLVVRARLSLGALRVAQDLGGTGGQAASELAAS